MALTTIEQVLDAVATALENVKPDVRPNVVFRRWRGATPIDQVAGPMRERAFMMRLGAGSIPRTISSPSLFWCRAELQLHIGYNLQEPRQNDVMGIGIDHQVWADERAIRGALAFGNPLGTVANVKRMVLISVDPPTERTRVYRFDLEWAEVGQP